MYIPLPTVRRWSYAQLGAVATYIGVCASSDLPHSELDDSGLRHGEYRGVRFEINGDGIITIDDEATPDDAMAAVITAYNAWAAEGFPH